MHLTSHRIKIFQKLNRNYFLTVKLNSNLSNKLGN
jgi:hypothetical protein